MSESDNSQLSSLGWVKDEINKSLDEARTSLEAYVENNDEADPAGLQRCHELIQQVRGTLQMVQLQGALLLAEEMIRLIDALLANSDTVEDPSQAYEVLMRAILQLPDYFERVQSGQTDAAIILLPLINNLRSAYGEDAAVAEALFAPNFNGILPPEVDGLEPLEGGDLSVLIKRARHQIHLSMLGLFRGKNVEESLGKIIELYGQFYVTAHSEVIKQLYWVASALCEGILDGGLDPEVLPVKPLLGQIDRQSKIIIDDGEEKLAADPPSELVRILLYYVASSSSEGERVAEVKSSFRLREYLPEEQELQKLRDNLAGPSSEVIETVVQGITQELDRARDMLDIYNRTGEQDTERLQQMVQALRNAAGTVAMIGDTELQAAMNDYCDNIGAFIAGDKTAEEAGMPGLADFILQVDLRIQDLKRENVDQGVISGAGPSLVSSTGSWDVRRAVVKESAVNMGTVKDMIAAFVEDPDTGREQLTDVSGLLQQIAGGLKVAALDRASDIVYALRSFVDQEMIQSAKTPTEQELESLAEAISSADYYLEAVIDELPNKETALDMAEAALDLLGYAAGNVDQELEELAGGMSEEDSETELLVEEDSLQLESLEADLEQEYGEEGDKETTDSFELNPEELAQIDDDAAAIEEVPLEEAVSEVEEGSADVEEIEVSPPEESEEEMSMRLTALSDSVDLSELPSIEAVEEMPDTEVEELSVDAPVESEAEMQARIQGDIEERAEQLEDTGEIEVSELRSEVEAVDLEGDEEVVAEDVVSEESEGIEGEEVEESLAGEQVVPAAETEPEGIQDSLMNESPLGDDLDEEIVEIFLEEAEEVLGELRQHFPAWRDDTGNTESLTIVRRSFHTLKGSGRMVGANQIGEFSWSIENLLNKVIDNSIEAGPEVMNIIDQAIDVLPVMVGQLQGGPAPDVDINKIPGIADALAAGKSVDSGQEEIEPDVSAEKKIHKLAPTDEEDSYQAEALTDSALNKPLDSEEIRLVYTEETNQHLNGLREFIDRCRADQGECFFREPEILILHTLHGGSATVGADGLKKIFDILEPLAILFNEHDEEVSAALLELCERIIDQAHLFLDEVNGGDRAFVLDVELVEELGLLFQQQKMLLDADTGSIDICKVIPDEGVAEAGEEAGDGEASGSFDEGALDEISTSLEDLHDLMQPEVDLEDIVDTEFPATEKLDEQPGGSPDAAEPAAETAGDVDPEILDIFLDEAAELLVSIEQTLDDWQNDQDNQDLMVSIQRDIHTLKGGARMVNQSAIADIGHAMETLLTAVVDAQVEVSEPMFSVLHEARDALHDLYEDLKQGQFNAATDIELISKLESLRRGKPVEEAAGEEVSVAEPPVAGPEEDEGTEEPSYGFDLIEIFMEEAGELLQSIDHTLDEWKGDEDNRDLIVHLQRDIHTLKGGARMVNLTGIGNLGHDLETLLTAVVDGHVEVTRPLLDGMQEVKDELQTMYEKVRQGGGDSDVSERMVSLLRSLRHNYEVPEEIGGISEEVTPSHMLPAIDEDSRALTLKGYDGQDVTPSDALAALDDSVSTMVGGVDYSDVTPSGASDALEEDSSRLTRIVEETEKAEKKASPVKDKRTQPRVEHESIRVRSDLIDGLVNLAGETNIYRSRLEQQSSSFRFSLSELDNTVIRLKEQLKKLETETDAQILFRHETELDNPEHESFDPLEMDRYSTMQQLSRSLVESVGDLNSLQDMLGGLTKDSELLLLQQGRVNSELQDRLMQARVVPFAATMASRLRRITRQTCQQLAKQAELKIQGANEEMDRHVLDRMVAPLEHMIRNSIAHGIELPEVRKSRGKPETGTITVSVRREGGEIVIQVADDGAGMDTQAIRKKAESKGLIVENADMTDDEVMQLVMTPGFTTADSVSQIAGRGVGMDVVNNEIRQLNGSVHIESVIERGAEITVRLPFTLSITQALLVGVANDLYAIPLNSIEGVTRIGREEAEQLIGDKDSSYAYGGDDYQLSSLGSLLGRPARFEGADEKKPAIILVRAGGHRVGFYIDELLGNHEIVVKSLGAQVSSVNGMAGGTILGDGRVALILDVPALVRMVGAEHGMSETRQVQVIETPKSVKLTVMVVDDSITVRRVTTRLLERHEMEVVTAKDGVDAVAKLEETVPDVMLLDVEMPRMDGYELATHMRNDARYQNVPIVMITSRTGEKHRERAEAIGVDRYLGKPYQELDLLDNINQVLEERRTH